MLNVLQKQKFGNFWFQTGTPTYLVDLLKQSGYLTIKGYDKEVLLYTLVFPNDEVRYAFLNFIANEVKNEQKSKKRQGFLKKEKHIPRGHTSP